MPALFLSTPSVRRATSTKAWRSGNKEISIHALRTEGDVRALSTATPTAYFYPRPPYGGRPRNRPHRSEDSGISIHALRTEGDAQSMEPVKISTDFYPRPPYGGRQQRTIFPHAPCVFLSTPSVRRATLNGVPSYGEQPFLSTPSVRRATMLFCVATGILSYFYPRPPYGGRLDSRP